MLSVRRGGRVVMVGNPAGSTCQFNPALLILRGELMLYGSLAVTMAELAAGPHLAADQAERARRQARLQQVEALFDPLPLDASASRSYGQVVAAVVAAGRSHRSRVTDLLIAATAHSNRLALYTRNADDFSGLEDLISVVVI